MLDKVIKESEKKGLLVVRIQNVLLPLEKKKLYDASYELETLKPSKQRNVTVW